MRHYKSSKHKALIQQTSIGPMGEFYTIYEQNMTGDFPILIELPKRQELYIPSRVKDELKWLNRGSNPKSSNKSGKLRCRADRAYFIKPGFGFIGSRYVYKEMSELIGRTLLYKNNQEEYVYRLLKCQGVDISDDHERAIFVDKNGKCYLNHDDLHRLGYSHIIPE